MELSEQQIQNFNRDGFLLIKGMFRGEELHSLSLAADRVIAEGMRGEGEGHWRTEVSDPRTYFRSERILDRDRVFEAASVNPDLLRCVGQCMGRPFLLLNDALITKLARTGVPVAWHQDPPYQGDEGCRDTVLVPNFVADIYLDQSNLENGCLHVLPRRHLCGRVTWQGLEEENLFSHPEAHPIIAEPGDVSFHALSIPHGSRANRSAAPRRLLLYHFVCREVFDNDYADWMHVYGGYSTTAVARLHKMCMVRENLSWPSDWTDVVRRYPYYWRTDGTRTFTSSAVHIACNLATREEWKGPRWASRFVAPPPPPAPATR